MTRLLCRIAAFASLNVAAAGIWLSLDAPPAACERWETDANLAVMPRDASLDVVFAGSSHGWALTACPGSAAAVETALGPNTLNLSKKGCGPLPALCYLQRFFAQGNRADALVYVIDPWAIAYRRWNEDAPFLRDEPFDPGFWARAAANGVSAHQLAAATRARFTGDPETHPARGDWCARQLESVQPEHLAKRRAYLYPGAFEPAAIHRYADTVEGIVRLARTHDTDVLFIIPPTLLGPLPGHDELRALLRRLETESGVAWIDASSAIALPDQFRDHDHLNTSGVQWLTAEIIAPALAGDPA